MAASRDIMRILIARVYVKSTVSNSKLNLKVIIVSLKLVSTKYMYMYMITVLSNLSVKVAKICYFIYHISNSIG